MSGHYSDINAHIGLSKFKSLMLAYRVLDGSAPTYLNALVRANVTPRMLRSSSERRLALPSVQVRQSRLFSFVVPRWWNELPSTTRAFFCFLCKIVFIVTLGLYCSLPCKIG